MAIRNRAVNFQQHLFLLILDDLQRLGTPLLLTVRKTAGPSHQSTVYSHVLLWLETDGRRRWKVLHRLLTGKMLSIRVTNLAKQTS
jgi:hypothetical protein